MSASQIVGGIAGIAVTIFTMNPYYGLMTYAAISSIGNALFPPNGPDGPRLQDLTPQASEYGRPIARGYGTIAVQGNVIWASDLVERSHEEGGKGSGGGSKVFTYYANFAVGLVEAPPEGIAGVSRIWAGPDKRLIYDVTPGSTITSEGGTIRVYNGADTQMPSALQESYEGVGNVPAYRGLAYVELEMFPLARDHNTIPFLTVEVMMKADSTIPPVTRFGQSNCADQDPATGYIWTNPTAGTARTTGFLEFDLAGSAKHQVQVWDPISRTMKGLVDTPPWLHVIGDTTVVRFPTQGALCICGGKVFVGAGLAGWEIGSSYPLGRVYDTKTLQNETIAADCHMYYGFDGVFYFPTVPIPVIDNNAVYFAGGDGLAAGVAYGAMPASIRTFGQPDLDPIPIFGGERDMWYTPGGWSLRVPKDAICPPGPTTGAISVTGFTLPDSAIMAYVAERPNKVLVLGRGGYATLIGDSHRVTGFSISAPEFQASGTLFGTSVDHVPAVVYDPHNECAWAFCGTSGGALYKVTTGGMTSMSMNVPGGHHVIAGAFDHASGFLRLFTYIGTGGNRYILLYDPITNTIEETVPANINATAYPLSIPVGLDYRRVWNYEKHGMLVYNDGENLWSIPYRNSLTAQQTTLAQVVRTEHLRSGMTLDQIDVSQLEGDIVDGYQIARVTTIRACIDALRPVYYFDSVESNGVVKYVKRGGSPVVTIPDSDLAARLDQENPVDPLMTTRQMENELPAGVNVTYLSRANDYDKATKYQRRQIGASGEQTSMDLPLVLSDMKAQQVADVNTFGPWIARLQYECQLPRKYAYLEPTDPIVVKGINMRVIDISDTPYGVRKVKAVREDASQYSPNSIVTEDLANGGAILDPVLTLAALLDVNMVHDADDPAGFYAAMAATDSPWSSAILYRSTDDGASYSDIWAFGQSAVMGTSTSALGDWQQNIFDEVNRLNVMVYGTLSSATELAVLNGANVAVLGREILQFKNATLEADGSYTLTGLLRGRRGTEWAAALHQDRDVFVLMTDATVARIAGTTGELGLVRAYKAVTAGATLGSTASFPFANRGAGLMPYSPVSIGGGRNAAGDLTINWIRRSRISGEWRDYVDVPQVEATEAYEIDIISGNNEVLRTLRSNAPTVTYTAAEQTADLGTVGGYVSTVGPAVGEAHASATSDGDPNNLFDKSTVAGWFFHGVCWVKWEYTGYVPLVEAYRITEFPINPATALTGLHGPIEWNIDVSDDGDTWTTVDSVTGEPGWVGGDVRTYVLDSPLRKRFWRMTITGIQDGGPYVMMKHFELVSKKVPVAIYQMSNLIGRGYAGIAEV